MAQRSRHTACRANHRRRKRTKQIARRQDDLDSGSQTSGLLKLQRTIGNRATAALVQRQREEGSATIVGSSAAEEKAADTDSYTQSLIGEGEQAPGEAELEQAMEQKAAVPHFRSQHPTIAQLGIRPQEILGEKMGVYISNTDYQHEEIGDLPGAAKDAEDMKTTMEGHDYLTLGHYKDENAGRADAAYRMAIQWAKKGDSLMLYYAGHGVPEGLVGVEADWKKPEPSQEAPASDENRGFKLQADQLTDVLSYDKILSALEGSVADGVHTTLIADACHSGAGADLVRDKAVEKVATEGGDQKVQAVAGQIARLEELKQHLQANLVEAATESPAAEGEAVQETKNPAQLYWETVVRPELASVAAYLNAAGMETSIPETLGDYTAAGIEQQINLVINKLVDLAEQIKKEREASTLQKAPG